MTPREHVDQVWGPMEAVRAHHVLQKFDLASALSDVCRATVVSDFAFVLNFESCIH